ncbi:glycosyltransferase [Aestuariibaculum suncheonense]|uniref:Glycosyltransferase n=1 Tax=Aestuariibaculum suncheonense TaxID=1028745 RepID=A0A8J6QN51_9FLAO|nr:glycosyltransferase [Aestuariibaculum suncheonense]MBD0833814.1 glycosyltransferase [Aestuariibaculum suncheonense]
MKKALIHDWYYVNGGAEKVLKSLNNIWSDFDHYALIDFLSQKDREEIFVGDKSYVNTSFIQKLPTSKSNHRKFLEFFPYAIEQFDLSEYDLIISSSASIAKGVLTNSNQLHISYIHSPMRYAWDLYHPYLKESKLKGIKAWYAKRVLSKIRLWDVLSTNRVDYLIANSNYIAKRIKKVYRRDSIVIYPPVDISSFALEKNKEDYYVTASRFVPYKKIDLIVEAFSKMKDKTLVVIGDGPEKKKIQSKMSLNIILTGHIEFSEVIRYFQKAKAFIFAAEEDFGIVPVEAQACGTPVLAYGKGGALETIEDGVSGTFFYEQSVEAIINGVSKIDKMEFAPEKVRANAEKFGKERFEKEFKEVVEIFYKDWKEKINN